MADIIYHSVNIFPGDGVKVSWDFQFDGVTPDTGSGTAPYIKPADVKVQEVWDEDGIEQVVQRVASLTAPSTVLVAGAPIPLGRNVRIYRETEVRFPLVDYRDRQVVTEADLDLQARQTLFGVMEVRDSADAATLVANSSVAQSVQASKDSAAALLASNAATTVADEARTIANRAETLAGQADGKADAALLAAQSAEEHATNVETLAAGAVAASDEAKATADSANSTALAAKATAEGIDAKATAAVATADAATLVADDAKATADNISGTANNALAQSEQASQTAQSALDLISTAVTSFNGRGGAVMPTAGDYTAAQVTFGTSTVGTALSGVAKDTFITGFGWECLPAPSPLTLKVLAGSAYVPAAGRIVVVPSDLTITFTRGTANSRLHLYLKADGTVDARAGSISAPYAGTARQDTDGARYLGSIQLTVDGAMHRHRCLDGVNVEFYGGQLLSPTFLLDTVHGTTPRALDLNAALPNSAVSFRAYWGVATNTLRAAPSAAYCGYSVTPSTFTRAINPPGYEMVMDFGPDLRIQYVSDVAGGAVAIRMYGYKFAR